MVTVPFSFVDLFAGVGGFHAALAALGGEGVLAAEIDRWAADVYQRNWGLKPEHDVIEVAGDVRGRVPEHTVLAGGFPCQPFSKGGHQRGMSEVRGQMVNEILKILAVRKPAVVFLENVRNLAGPRQRPVWDAVVQGLREAGYRVPGEPAVFSPHLLPPQLGGSAQSRDRIYLLGTYVGRDRALREVDVDPIVQRRPVGDWDPENWDIERDVLLSGLSNPDAYELDEEVEWIDVWNDFLARVRPARLPGFPMWSTYWDPDVSVDADAPWWKQRLEQKNVDFYAAHRRQIDAWKRANPRLRGFPASRQKLEWQAQDKGPRDLRTCLLHFRPSGIRAKRPTYSPALVAMAQTPVFGPLGRRLTPREAARLQGFPDWFDFGDQADVRTYKQMGNAIHVGAAYYALREHIRRDADDVSAAGGQSLVEAVNRAPARALDSPHLAALAHRA